MRTAKYMVLAMALSLCALGAEAKSKKAPKEPKPEKVYKNKMSKAYVFGFSASFNDSTVYFTDVQNIDSMFFTGKTKFLVNRDQYAYQLRNYLSDIGEHQRTCIVSYAIKRKKVEKKYLKLRKRYLSKRNFDIRYIEEKDFRFQPVVPDENQ